MAKLLVTLQMQFEIEGEDETDTDAVDKLVETLETQIPLIGLGASIEVESVEEKPDWLTVVPK